MVNNYDQIGHMIGFEDKFDFYFVQIIKRRKDNPDLKRDMNIIANFYIESFEQYGRLMPHIISMCDNENARAYFRINRRNYKHLSYHILKRVVDVISSGMVKSLKGTFDTVAGQYHSDKDKKWIVDIDDDIPYDGSEVKEVILRLQGETKKEPYFRVLPTKNGVHYITRPFNLKKFKDDFPGIDVHKDNPTILYCP